jgi:hypothetical protein
VFSERFGSIVNLHHRIKEAVLPPCRGRRSPGRWHAVVVLAVLCSSVSVGAGVDSVAFAAGSGFVAVDPGRLLETRAGASPTVDGLLSGIGVRAAGSTTEVQVAGRGGVAVGAVAASLNVTVVGATGGGYLSVFPCGGTPPNASNINFADGWTIANAVISKLSADGKVCVFTSARADVIIDVNGSFAGDSTTNPPTGNIGYLEMNGKFTYPGPGCGSIARCEHSGGVTLPRLRLDFQWNHFDTRWFARTTTTGSVAFHILQLGTTSEGDLVNCSGDASILDAPMRVEVVYDTATRLAKVRISDPLDGSNISIKSCFEGTQATDKRLAYYLIPDGGIAPGVGHLTSPSAGSVGNQVWTNTDACCPSRILGTIDYNFEISATFGT